MRARIGHWSDCVHQDRHNSSRQRSLDFSESHSRFHVGPRASPGSGGWCASDAIVGLVAVADDHSENEWIVRQLRRLVIRYDRLIGSDYVLFRGYLHQEEHQA